MKGQFHVTSKCGRSDLIKACLCSHMVLGAQTLHCCDRKPASNCFQEKGHFWLMASVCGQLAPKMRQTAWRGAGDRDVYGIARKGTGRGFEEEIAGRGWGQSRDRHTGNKSFRSLLSDEPCSSHGLTFHNNAIRFLSHQWLNPLLKLELSGSTTSHWLGLGLDQAFSRWTFWEILFI